MDSIHHTARARTLSTLHSTLASELDDWPAQINWRLRALASSLTATSTINPIKCVPLRADVATKAPPLLTVCAQKIIARLLACVSAANNSIARALALQSNKIAAHLIGLIIVVFVAVAATSRRRRARDDLCGCGARAR